MYLCKMKKFIFTTTKVVVILVIALTLTIIGCSSWNYSISTIAGLYSSELSAYGRQISFTLELNPDSTYKYRYKYDKADFVSDGEWHICNNKVLLNSYIQDYNKFGIVCTCLDRISDSPEITILSSKLDRNTSVFYVLKNGDTIRVDGDTLCIHNTSFPIILNLLVQPKNFYRTPYAVSENILIKFPGVYQIESRGVFLYDRPLDYIIFKDKPLKITKNSELLDFKSTNIVLKKQKKVM